MMYVLDTNVVSELRKVASGKADAHLVRWTEGVDAAEVPRVDTRRGERITIKVNGVRVGVADLEEPAEDEDTSAYFAAIIRLAQHWFPGQVFAYGYESLHLYILPTELVSWLEANGFTNSLNYFGDAAAEQ